MKLNLMKCNVLLCYACISLFKKKNMTSPHRTSTFAGEIPNLQGCVSCIPMRKPLQPLHPLHKLQNAVHSPQELGKSWKQIAPKTSPGSSSSLWVSTTFGTLKALSWEVLGLAPKGHITRKQPRPYTHIFHGALSLSLSC